MHIGKTLNTNYIIKFSIFPGSFMETNKVNLGNGLDIWTISTLKPSLHCDKAASNATHFLELPKMAFEVFQALIIFY